MQRSEFLAQLNQKLILGEQTLWPEMVLADMHWDSMHSLEFQSLIDELFDIQVDSAELRGCKTLADLCDLAKLEPGE
ncbi:MAG: acyl carrier protein [Pseudohongiellaceae bacterium]|jgi:acyl carrier protein